MVYILNSGSLSAHAEQRKDHKSHGDIEGSHAHFDDQFLLVFQFFAFGKLALP
jgi:hypothetical protein